MTIFIPIIDVTYKGSIKLLKIMNPSIIVVRLLDLAIRNSNKPNKLFYNIIKAGGLHAYLRYDGIIVFSLIMPDDQIRVFNPSIYAYFINALKPNYYTTVDGWTYHKQFRESMKEIYRTIKETKQLIKLCPNLSPLGLVKGCTELQLDAHSSWLLAMGIKDFVFHIGDYRRNGIQYHMESGKYFAEIIRKKARKLFLYGYGSQKQLISHSFADGYISNKHFVTANVGLVYKGTQAFKYRKLTFEEAMIENYIQIQRNMESLRYQTRLNEVNLSRWVMEAEQEELQLDTQVVQALAVVE